MMVRLALVLSLLSSFFAAKAEAQVVVFPLDPRGVSVDTAEVATDAVVDALRAIERLQVIDPTAVEARLNVDLTRQARACEYDVFCLVEVGEILQTATVLLGHVSRRPGESAESYELKLVVLDVDRAAIAEVLIWRLRDLTMLDAAATAAGRRLFAPHDAQVDLRIDPPTATVRLYADPQVIPRSGRWAMWSGEYRLRVEAEGYLPVERAWILAPGESVLTVALDPDPLYVRPVVRAAPVQPFDEPSRRLGSGATARDVGAVKTKVEPRSRFARPWPWITATLGMIAAGAGIAVMVTAQNDYNEVADEVRFTAPDTTRSDLARQVRDDANFRHQVGSGVLVGGAVLTVGGLLWLLLGGDETPEAAAVAPGRGAPMTAAHRRAAADLARSLVPPKEALSQ